MSIMLSADGRKADLLLKRIRNINRMYLYIMTGLKRWWKRLFWKRSISYKTRKESILNVIRLDGVVHISGFIMTIMNTIIRYGCMPRKQQHSSARSIQRHHGVRALMYPIYHGQKIRGKDQEMGGIIQSI